MLGHPKILIRQVVNYLNIFYDKINIRVVQIMGNIHCWLVNPINHVAFS